MPTALLASRFICSNFSFASLVAKTHKAPSTTFSLLACSMLGWCTRRCPTHSRGSPVALGGAYSREFVAVDVNRSDPLQQIILAAQVSLFDDNLRRQLAFISIYKRYSAGLEAYG